MTAATRTMRVLALGLLVGVGGCGELTAGGIGEATVLVTGGPVDAPGTSGPAPGASASAPARAPSAGAGQEIVGTVTATLQVFVGGGTDARFVELTDGPTTVTVDILGQDEAQLATRALDVDAYTRVRFVYGAVSAFVESGLVVDGRPVTGLVRVAFESDQARTSEQDAIFQVRDEGTSVLVVGLNADAWLRTADADSREVPSDEFHGSVRTRPRDTRR